MGFIFLFIFKLSPIKIPGMYDNSIRLMKCCGFCVLTNEY